MTRQEIERDYKVQDGIIRSPGKFEGERVYVPYFWDDYLNGCCNGFAYRSDETTIVFGVSQEDRAMFPELGHKRTVRLYEREDGFVCEC